MNKIDFIRTLLSQPGIKFGLKLSRFLLVGIPAFTLSIFINWFLVKKAMWDEAFAYAIVLVIQVIINFFMCRWFVFLDKNSNPIWIQFGQFMSGILLLRFADWLVYTLLVSILGIYYLAVQIFNIFAFSILKFKYSQKVIEG